MTILVLRPESNGTLQDFTASSGNAYECVDEVTANDADYIWKGQASAPTLYPRSTFNLPNPSAEGTINSVTVYARCKDNGNVNARIRLGVHNGTTYTETSDIDATNSYALYSQTWNNNPNNSNNPWTWSDINSLQPLVYGKVPYATAIYFSQVYVEVDYTPLTYSPSLGRGIMRGVF